jgi:hypothetical protein
VIRQKRQVAEQEMKDIIQDMRAVRKSLMVAHTAAVPVYL